MSEEKCILVVEDDDDARLFFSAILRRNHYAVLAAENAAKARQLIAANSGRIDAILLDLMLPGDEDGLSLARFLRRQEPWKQVPIIAVTAALFDADRTNVFAAGCNAHVAKPVVGHELLELLSLYLRRPDELRRD